MNVRFGVYLIKSCRKKCSSLSFGSIFGLEVLLYFWSLPGKI